MQILVFLIKAAMRMPRLTIAIALLLLTALAGIIAYTGFLVIGVLADYLGTGQFVAGLLLGCVFARLPWISNRKLRIVGLLPKPLRQPLMAGLLALCLLNFLARGEYVHAVVTGFSLTFLLAYPRAKGAIASRMSSSVFNFAARKPRDSTDDMVIDGEFREKKD